MQSEMDLHVIDGLRKKIKELNEENTELAIKWGECGGLKNRYREALEKIVSVNVDPKAVGSYLQDIARAALDA